MHSLTGKQIGIHNAGMPEGSSPQDDITAIPSVTGEKTLFEEKEGQFPMLIRFREDVDNMNLRGMLLLQNLEQFGTIIQCIPDRATIEDWCI